jgi:hypothetical protein
MKIIKNTEMGEMKYRPLERILEIAEENGKLVVKTTYEHLARKIGNALHSAYKGDLKIQYLEGENYVRVWWNRQ